MTFRVDPLRRFRGKYSYHSENNRYSPHSWDGSRTAFCHPDVCGEVLNQKSEPVDFKD